MPLIAQISTEVVSTLVSSLGVVGALVWYLYHNTTKTIPDLTKQYTESQEKIASQFAATQERTASNFADTLKEERSYRAQEIKALQEWIRSEASCKYNSDTHQIRGS